MQNVIERLLKDILLVLIIIIVILILFFSHYIASILVPIIFAFLTAVFLHPFIDRLQKIKIPYIFSVLIVYSIFILIFVLIFTIITLSFTSFMSEIPDISIHFRESVIMLLDKISESDIEILNRYFNKEELKRQFENFTNQLISIETMKTYILTPLGETLNTLKSFLIYAVSLIFIIPLMDNISDKILNAFPESMGHKVNKVFITITEQVQNYLVAKSIISLSVGILSFIICLIFKIKYALLWGVVIFLLNYVPYIGPIISTVFPMTLSIFEYQSFLHLISLTLSLTIVHFIIGNIIEPKFMSKGVNLGPLVIIISVLIWGYIWGAAGIILSVPMMSVINLICENITSLKPISVLISAKKHNIQKSS